MNFKKIGIILFLILSLLPISRALAETTSNAGFVPGNIWYSKDPFVEGDKIKIYTLIFNPDTRKFSGTVDFYDNNVILGTKDFSVAGTSTKDIYINWTVTAGSHEIFGQIKNAKFLTSTGTTIEASLAENTTSKSSRTVTNKVVAQNITNSVNTMDSAFNTALDSIQNIGNTAKDVLPTSVSKSVDATTNTFDTLRDNTSTTLQNAQKETQNNINALKNKKTTDSNIFQKPFEYIKLFFFTILSIIFEYKIAFYGILIIIIFFLIRYIWHLIF